MNRLIILSFFILPLAAVCQPALYFYNAQVNKIIVAKPGDQLVVMYKGYNNQTEFYREIITEITDSTVTLGNNYNHANNFISRGQKRKAEKLGPNFKVIAIKDIVAFRRIGVGSILTKSVLQIGSVLGLVVLAEDVFESSSFSSSEKFLITFGAGLATKVLLTILFPEGVKYQMSDGWQSSSVKPQTAR
jgi:hypothetical protein